MADIAPVCELIGVGRTYGGRPPVTALTRADMTIMPGDFIAIQGPSGSGKSTLLNIVGLLDPPTTGSYNFNRRPIGDLSRRDLAALRAGSIGFVFQAFHLLSRLNVIDNVALGGRYADMSRVEAYRRAYETLDSLGLGDRTTAFPSTLSGGERQRVAIARATIGAKQLLLCDEPTGNLDGETTEQVLDVLARANRQGLAILVVTHDPKVSQAASTRLSLVDGVLHRP